MAATPSSSDHLMVGFLVSVFERVAAKEAVYLLIKLVKYQKKVNINVSTMISLMPRIRYSVDSC